MSGNNAADQHKLLVRNLILHELERTIGISSTDLCKLARKCWKPFFFLGGGEEKGIGEGGAHQKSVLPYFYALHAKCCILLPST